MSVSKKNNLDSKLASKSTQNMIDNTEYTRSLEISVELLQKEVELLRSKLFPNLSSKGKKGKLAKKDSSLNELVQIIQFDYFLTCSNINELISKLNDILENDFAILESNFFITNNNRLVPISYSKIDNNNDNSNLYADIAHLEEQGISDWVFTQNKSKAFPNLRTGSKLISNVLIPIKIYGTNYGVFALISKKQASEFSDELLETLRVLISKSAIWLDNLKCKEDLNLANLKLEGMNRQLLEASKLASVGDLSYSISREISNPLNTIDGHLKLIDSGVGDPKIRLHVIKEQFDKIKSVNQRLEEIASSTLNQQEKQEVEICDVIDQVLLLINSQLENDDIKITKDFEASNFKISVYKSQIEQVILNLFQLAKESMDEGGEIKIGVYQHNSKQLVINISDNGMGIKEEDLPFIFEPFYKTEASTEKHALSLFFIKNIVLQNNGMISVVSEYGRGSTIKLFFNFVQENV